MATQDLMSINTVAAKLGLSVHQLRRWELMFGLDIKRGRGQQRQYRPEDLTVLERIKELVEQGWPTSQIRPQIEAEGLITPRLIGVPQQPGNPEVVLESIIGFRNFAERRFIELSKQIDELRQLVISITLKQELAGEADSPWKPVPEEEEEEIVTDTEPEEPVPERPVEEITLGPEVAVSTDVQTPATQTQAPSAPVIMPSEPVDAPSAPVLETADTADSAVPEPSAAEPASVSTPESAPAPAPAPVTAAKAAPAVSEFHIDEVTDQNYLTVLGKALDIIGWTDEQADEFSEKTYQVPHWDELGRSHAERMVAHIKTLLSDKQGGAPAEADSKPTSEPAPAPTPAPAPEPAPSAVTPDVTPDQVSAPSPDSAPATAPVVTPDQAGSEPSITPVIKPLSQPADQESGQSPPATPPTPAPDQSSEQSPDSPSEGGEQSFNP